MYLDDRESMRLIDSKHRLTIDDCLMTAVIDYPELYADYPALTTGIIPEALQIAEQYGASSCI